MLLELIKHGGFPHKTRFFNLHLLQDWEKEAVPSDLNDPNIVTIFQKEIEAFVETTVESISFPRTEDPHQDPSQSPPDVRGYPP